jgi:hypothetical protein
MQILFSGRAAIRTGIAALALLTVPTLALAGAEGRWTQGHPSMCVPDAMGLEVQRDGFSFYETRCRFGGRAPSGFSSVSGTMQCSSEGEDFARRVALSADGNHLTLRYGGEQPLHFSRCAGNGSARSGGGMTAGDVAAATILLGTMVKVLRDN